MDFMLAFVGLLLLGAAMLLVGLIIFLADGPPVLFGQERVGFGGKLFTMNKYRTMCNRKEAGTSITVSGDSRIAAVGKILRRFEIDELPQLINVLKGDMSLVGPRPEVAGYADQLQGGNVYCLEHREPGLPPASRSLVWPEETPEHGAPCTF